MQQDNDNMDKNLKQLENQSLPDLSKMDEHWNNMKGSLKPEDSLPKNKPNKRFFPRVVAALLVGAAFFIPYKFIFTNNDKTVATQKAEPVSGIISSKDTLPVIQFKPGRETSTVIGKDTIRFKPQEEKTYKDTIFLNGKTTNGKEFKVLATHVSSKKGRDTINFKPQKEKPRTIPILLKGKTTDGKEIQILGTPVNDTTNKKPAVDNKKAIQDFFAQIEKQSQSFTINNKRDTVIQGNEGTALLIPAYSFGGNNAVTITMKEYYSYKDIITNRLTTLSNDKLLVTGGMLHLIATINGKEVDIQPGKSIRWFVPDTTSQMKQMQLFNGVVNNASLRWMSENSDTLAIDYSYNINWIAQQQLFSGSYLYTNVKVLDLRDEPYKTRYTKDRKIGKFLIADDSKISKEDLKDYMVSKRGYDKVVIKKTKRYYRGFRLFGYRERISVLRTWNSLGDSVWMDLNIAKQFNLKPTDTIVSTISAGIRWYDFDIYDRKRIKQKPGMAMPNSNLNNLANRFSVDIRSLGWINCDRFYDDYRPKIDYIVNLGDNASNYYTLLVFDKIKSIMSGFASGNKVSFRNVPEGESVKIISVSIKNDKPVAAMQSVQISRKVLEGLKFEETTPAEFKEKAGSLDKP